MRVAQLEQAPYPSRESRTFQKEPTTSLGLGLRTRGRTGGYQNCLSFGHLSPSVSHIVHSFKVFFKFYMRDFRLIIYRADTPACRVVPGSLCACLLKRVMTVWVCGGCVGDCALCDASPCFCKLNLKLPAQLAAELQWCASVNYAVLMQCVQYGCSLSQHKRVFCQWPLAQLCLSA